MNQSFRLLFPLDVFYTQTGRTLPEAQSLEAAEMPEPYRQLLAGKHDMTPTLAAFHGGDIQLHVAERRQHEETLLRLVVLSRASDGQPVEFGAIVINLHHFPPAAREDILEGRAPLGTVLATYRIPHSSCPQAFLRVMPDPLICEALHLTETQPLYGRRNYLLTADNAILADILEILPPAPRY